jgi:ATP-dependent Clp protease ATP-binding subunit ClpA
MKSNIITMRGAAAAEPDPDQNLAAFLRRRIVGQDEAINAIAPYVQLFQSGLAPAGRPAGVFLLLGPTGTGKTRTVEALAEALHGHERHILRVDCGEFQLDHEVAKLIGAPPGYLGHRETQPMISQQKLNAAASERCPLSLVLFDEIEKAAGSLNRLLLGVLDKATLKLGDNTAVNFERSLIFLTSNLGAREMEDHLSETFGFGAPGTHARQPSAKLHSIALRAVRRRFSPEFVNRVDQTITYSPLNRRDFEAILDIQMKDLDQHLAQRLGPRAFRVELSGEARELLLNAGTSTRYGARELKRAIHRHVIQRIAALVVEGLAHPGGVVRVEKARGRDEVVLRPRRREAA